MVATFADDTALLVCNHNYPTAVANLQIDLDGIHEWTRRWKIPLNSEKSVNITFSLRPRTYTPVTLASQIVPYKSSAKYSGGHLDERLTYSDDGSPVSQPLLASLCQISTLSTQPSSAICSRSSSHRDLRYLCVGMRQKFPASYNSTVPEQNP